jgi:hypothetical protein
VNVAFLTTVLPGDRRGGGEVVSQAFVDVLREAGHRVSVVGYRRAGANPPLHEDDVVAGERTIETSAGRLGAAAWLAAALLRREPYSFAKYRSSGYRSAAAGVLASRPALVVMDHAQTAAAAGETDAERLVYLAHNVEGDVYAELADGARGPSRALLRREARHVRRLEEQLVRRADEVWTLTEADAQALGALGARRTRAFAVPATAAAPARPAPEPEADVALLGTWTWESNAAGLRWFRDEVLPALPPALTVRVAGAGAEAVMRADAERAAGDGRVTGGDGRVTTQGVVPDALAFLRAARVVAIPSVAGAGVQIKTLDAVASGRPVVATPTAVRGLDRLPPTVAVEGSPGAFAAALASASASGATAEAERVAAAWIEERRSRFGDAVKAAAAEAAA